jgi:hypothetical protein
MYTYWPIQLMSLYLPVSLHENKVSVFLRNTARLNPLDGRKFRTSPFEDGVVQENVWVLIIYGLEIHYKVNVLYIDNRIPLENPA